MTTLKALLPAVALLGLLLCAGNAYAGSLPLRNVARGGFSGIDEAKQEVIKDQAGWSQWWGKHRVKTGAEQKIPEVDFNKEMIIAVTMGRQRSGGYGIEIVKVETTDKQLQISVRRLSPPPGAMVMQALSAPFHFVAVPKSELKPEFLEVKTTGKK